jgi:hypothetical protein
LTIRALAAVLVRCDVLIENQEEQLPRLKNESHWSASTGDGL